MVGEYERDGDETTPDTSSTPSVSDAAAAITSLANETRLRVLFVLWDAAAEPVGFGVELLAGHAAFPDNVTATFRTRYDDDDGAIVSTLPRDASNVLVAKVTWQPEGTSGWHTHPGPVIVNVVEGELELINERDCVARTYGAGEAFIDPGQGNVHIASNPSTTVIAVAYATFLGVPDGQPATVWVDPVACAPATNSWRPGRRGVL